MKMIFAVMMGVVLSANAFAGDTVPPNVPAGLRVQAAPGACQPLTALDGPKLALRYNALALVNISGSNARAACSPNVDVSGNGTTEAGLYISNNDGGQSVQTVTCVATYNTAGAGSKQTTKSVMVSPGLIGKIGWETGDFYAFGGPISIICNLKPKTGVMRVYTISQHKS